MAPANTKQSVPLGKMNVKHPTLASLCLLLIADLEETGCMLKFELKKKISKSISHFSLLARGKKHFRLSLRYSFKCLCLLQKQICVLQGMLIQLSQLTATNSLSQTLGFPSCFLIPVRGNTTAS